MRALIDRLLWRVYRAVFKPQNINGMELVDIRVDIEDVVRIRRALHLAMQYIADAGETFALLVRRNVTFVAATREPAERVSYNLRAYLTPFRGHEKTNPFFLACRLVGVAEYFRQLDSGNVADFEARRIALESEVRFAEQFPDSEDWIRYLRRSPIAR